MSIKGIPVVTVGPGSQPAEPDGGALNYIDMPDGMSTYHQPSVDAEDIGLVAGARETMAWLTEALANYRSGDAPRLANLTGLDEASRRLVNELLGEGEVSITYDGSVAARSQESVLTGIWRTVYLDEHENIAHDLLEVADISHLAQIPPDGALQIPLSALGTVEVPDGVINARPIVAELAAAASNYAAGDPAHSINLSLLPMTDEDIQFLDSILGKGTVEILSRSYGKCMMLATAVPNIWWVRYFNSMNTLILNSLEVTGVPQVACAAPEDLLDSAGRLREILESEGAGLN